MPFRLIAKVAVFATEVAGIGWFEDDYHITLFSQRVFYQHLLNQLEIPHNL